MRSPDFHRPDGGAVVFADRRDAGRQLAARLAHLGATRPVVLALPRGGVPVATEVARMLGAPLDVVLVRKLGVPYQPELAVGAIGEGGVRVINEEVRRAAAVRDVDLTIVEHRERLELARRARAFRQGRPAVDLSGRTVLVVDDGIATGATAHAACDVARALGAARVVLAAPVIPLPTLASLRAVADEIACIESPEPFFAIGQWYRDFTQTTDAEVVAVLDAAAWSGSPDGPSPVRSREDRRGERRCHANGGAAVTTTSELLVDGFGRVRDRVHAVLSDISREALVYRPDDGANSICWLIWHLTRVQDDHVADVAGREQRWTAEGFFDRFELSFDPLATGYGQRAEQTAQVDVEPALLAEYHDAVHAATLGYTRGLTDIDLDRVVDTRWDPPVTLGVRLVSVLDDDLEHVGQAAYVRGLFERR